MGQEDGPSHTDCKMLTFAHEMCGWLGSPLTSINEQLSRGRETIAYGSSYISRGCKHRELNEKEPEDQKGPPALEPLAFPPGWCLDGAWSPA